MKRAIWCLLGTLVCTTPLSAQPRPSGRTDLPAALNAAAAEDPKIQEAIASRPLFFALAADQFVEEGQELEFRVLLNGQLHVQENLPLEVRSAPGSAFELLATRPDLLGRLYDLSRDRANRLEIHVLLGSEEIGAFSSFADFVGYNREIKRKGIVPRHAPSRLLDLAADETSPGPASRQGTQSVAAKSLGYDQACVLRCYDDYNWNVDTYGCDYGDCSRWDSLLQTCIQSCPIVCTDPKNVTEPTRVELVSYSWGTSGCFERPWENDFYMGDRYTTLVLYNKYTKVRRTEYCDGHVVEQVLQVWYGYQSCWHQSGGTCFYPSQRIYNQC